MYENQIKLKFHVLKIICMVNQSSFDLKMKFDIFNFNPYPINFLS